MDVAELVVEYLKTLAWPVVALIVLFVLREPLKAKFADLLSLEWAGRLVATFRLPADMSGDLTEEVSEPAQRLASSDPTVEDRRRDDVEEIIRFAITWTYQNAGLFTSTPTPEITWDHDGSPSIAFPDAPEGGSGKIELFKDKSDQYRFRLKAPNGEIALHSENYASHDAALRAIDAIRRLRFGKEQPPSDDL